jgi:uncharacterized protein YggE
MKKILSIGLFVSITLITHVNAQVSGNYLYNNLSPYQNASRLPSSNANINSNDEITIEVNGLMNIVADNYVATFNLVQVGETADNTDALMNDRINSFKQELKRAGIDTNSIKVDMVSFVPKYEIQTENKIFSKTYNEVPVGFEMQKNVTVLYKNAAKLDEIVTAAAKSEIYDLVKVDYFIPSLLKSLDSLKLKCLQEIKAKIKSYEIIGFKLDTMKKVMADNYATIYPQTRYFSYQANCRPSMNAAKKKNQQQMVNEADKPVSRFYAALDCDKYDLVINPVVTEPVVQISYSVKVKYFLPAAPKDKYYILSPSGNTTQIFP